MSLNEFIRLEAEAFDVLRNKDPNMVWKAIECGAAEKIRLYAESKNYEVSLNELLQILLIELCFNLAQGEIQYLA